MQKFDFNNFSLRQETQRTETVESAVMAGVYRWMATGLLLTGIIAYFTAHSPMLVGLIFGNPILFMALAIGEVGLVWYVSARIGSMTVEKAGSLFYVYSALNGLTLASIFLIYTQTSIASTFFITAGTFGAMSIYGYTTKKDLTSWGSFFFMGLIGILIASVVNIFLRSPALNFAISYLGVFIFIGLTAYDTQKIKYMVYSARGEEATKMSILGALILYLDFVNMFIFLLRIFGTRRD